MTKLERAIKEAEKLPPDEQERLGEELLHYIHKSLALRDDLAAGVKELDEGQGLDGRQVFRELKARYA